MLEAGRAAAGGRLVEKAKLYGRAQYHATREDWHETAQLFDRLGEVEVQLIESMS